LLACWSVFGPRPDQAKRGQKGKEEKKNTAHVSTSVLVQGQQ
jgi:hypothetical protein